MHGILLDKFTKKVLEIAATTFAVSAATMIAERLADRLVYGAPPSQMPPMEEEPRSGTTVNIIIHGGNPQIILENFDKDEEEEENENVEDEPEEVVEQPVARSRKKNERTPK